MSVLVTLMLCEVTQHRVLQHAREHQLFQNIIKIIEDCYDKETNLPFHVAKKEQSLLQASPSIK